MNFCIEEPALVALIFDDEEKENRKRNWVHPIWVLRGVEGEFVALDGVLVDEESKFHE